MNRGGRILLFNPAHIAKQCCGSMSQDGTALACVWGEEYLLQAVLCLRLLCYQPVSKPSQGPGDTHLVSSTGSSHENMCDP